MSDEPKECNILKLILILRFAGATLDVGHPIEALSLLFYSPFDKSEQMYFLHNNA
jgi:hypothetical protein